MGVRPKQSIWGGLSLGLFVLLCSFTAYTGENAANSALGWLNDLSLDAPEPSSHTSPHDTFEKWADERRGSFGDLVTHPLKAISPDVAEAQNYLVELLLERTRAGEKFKRLGITPIINIYDSPEPNAFVYESRADLPDTEEGRWRTEHPGKKWPIRESYHVSDSKPFVEIGVTKGLLRKLKFEGRLAFVLAHEATHFFEGHTGPGKAPTVSRWWSGQSNEVAADLGALDLISGHQNLDDAIRAAHDLAEPDKTSDYVFDAASTHPYDSVRVEILQTAVDAKYRDGGSSRIPEKPIPHSVVRITDRSQRVRALKEIYMDHVKTMVSNPSDHWLTVEEEGKLCEAAECGPLREIGGKESEEFFDAALKEVETAKKPSDKKLKALFDVIQFHKNWVTGDGFNSAALKPLDSNPRVQALFNSLIRQTDPAELLKLNGGKINPFLALLHTAPVNRMVSHSMTEDPGAWITFEKKLPEAYLLNENGGPNRGKLDFRRLKEIVNWINAPVLNHSEYQRRLQQTTVAYLRNTPRPELEAMVKDLPQGYSEPFPTILNPPEHSVGDPSMRGLQEAIRPLLPYYSKNRIAEIQNKLSNGSSPDSLALLYAEIKTREPYLTIPRELESAVIAKLLKHPEQLSPSFLANYPYQFPAMTEILLRHDIQVQDRLKFLDYLISARYRATSVSREIQSATAKNVYEFFSEIGHEHLISYLQDPKRAALWLFLGGDAGVRDQVLSGLSSQETLHALKAALDPSARLSVPFRGEIILPSGPSELLMRLLTKEGQRPGAPGELLDLYSRLYRVASHGLDTRPGLREQIQEQLRTRLESFESSPRELLNWLKDPPVLKTLPAQDTAELVASLIGNGGSRASKIKATRALASELRLQEDYPELYRAYRNVVAVKFQIQPGEAELFFPRDMRPLTERLNSTSASLRALSAIASETQRQPFSEQYKMIRYLAGEELHPPAFVYEIGKKWEAQIPFLELLQKTRDRVAIGGMEERTFVINGILAGPRGMVESNEGLEFLLSKMLEKISPDQRSLARDVSEAMMRAYGPRRSLAISFLLGASKTKPGQPLTDAALLRGALRAHGMPGDKLGQYLAFTNPSLRDALGDLQDSTIDLSYFDGIDNLERRFGSDWPKKYRYLGPIGAGSANGAYLLEDLQTGKKVVASSLYPGIEPATDENFHRIRSIIDELTRTPEGNRKFGYLRELIPLIEDSVRLEFDKKNALNALTRASETYLGEMDGWKIRTVSPGQVGPGTLFMGLAPGKTARKVLEENPDAYRAAMRAWTKFEYRVLAGIPNPGSPTGTRPEDLLVNVDVHDGQLLIDEAAKTITVIDPGQTLPAVKVSEMHQGQRLLRAVSGMDSRNSVVTWADREFDLRVPLDAHDLDEILSDPDRMSRFVRLVSRLRAKGADVPLGAVNWAQAMNREIQLAAKVGTPVDRQVATMLVASKLGISDAAYNRGHLLMDSTVRSQTVRCMVDFLSRTIKNESKVQGSP